LYEIQQQIKTTTTTTKLIQTFPKEHSSSDVITSLLQINPNTLVSSCFSSSWSSSDSSNVIVIWSKSKSKSSSSLEYEPIQRITQKETGGGIKRLVLINQKNEEEEEFASCSFGDASIIIWRGGKGGKGEVFQIKQKITNVKGVQTLLYITLTNELISGSTSYSLLQIWSPSSSSSSSSDFVEKQKIETPSSCIESLCQINRNDSKRIEFASGHWNGQIMIWSKQQQINGSKYSSIKTLHPFNYNWVDDLIFLNDNEFNFLIACSFKENKIVIFIGEEEGVELEHKDVWRLIPMSNGTFASGGRDNQCLNIWSPSSSSLP
jgi:hypothetical protein